MPKQRSSQKEKPVLGWRVLKSTGEVVAEGVGDKVTIHNKPAMIALCNKMARAGLPVGGDADQGVTTKSVDRKAA
jgi:hypothetical protein